MQGGWVIPSKIELLKKKMAAICAVLVESLRSQMAAILVTVVMTTKPRIKKSKYIVTK